MSTDTKERILETATKLIHASGYNNTTINHILQESKISKGNFFYYFKTKEDLGYAVIDTMSIKVLEGIKSHVNRQDLLPLDRIYVMMDSLVNRYRENGCLGGCPFGNLALEMADVHDEFRKRVANMFNAWEKLIKDTLDRAKQEGILKLEVDSEALAGFIIGSLEGAMLLMRAKKNIAPLDKSVQLIKHYIKCMCVNPSPKQAV